jgi:hypothetical protein
MVDVIALGEAVSAGLVDNPQQMACEVSTSGLTPLQMVDLLDAIFDACTAKGVKLKGFIVDPTQMPLLPNSDYGNAFVRRGYFVVVDINLNDRVVARRARRPSAQAKAILPDGKQ